MNNKNGRDGASIERGIISKKTDSGLVVSSYTRYGIVTPELSCLSDDIYLNCSVGDLIYFFMFEDGTGMVIGKARG